MADVQGGHSYDPHGASPGSAPQRWTVHPWRLVPPLLVLGTVAVIWITRYDQLLVNHWAYPVTLVVVGLFALLFVIGARPRRRPQPLPYPQQPPDAVR
jgi:hypothetical protein